MLFQEPNKTNDTNAKITVSETNEDIVHSDFNSKVVPYNGQMAVHNPELAAADWQTPILWQGANSNLPTSKKHTD